MIGTNGRITTEFWLTLATLIAATVLLGIGKVTGEVWLGVVVGNGGVYALGRTMLKRTLVEAVAPTQPDVAVDVAVDPVGGDQ